MKRNKIKCHLMKNTRRKKYTTKYSYFTNNKICIHDNNNKMKLCNNLTKH